jgi:replication initiation protein RepC
MQTHLATTPFGRRSLSLGMLAAQMAAKDVASTASVQKWQVFRDIKEARNAIGATDRGLAILDALLSFHPDAELSGASQLVVWPSNEQLIARANGMSPATLRRHLANLVECGLIIRRDSPNGKRFARKGEGGTIEQAYGFDLSPLVARAAEFKELAEQTRAERRAVRLAREKITIIRRDIVKMIETGIEEGVPGNWGRIQLAYQEIISRLPRTASFETLEAISAELDALWQDIRDALESFINSQNLNSNESQTERHIQNSNPDSKSESEHGLRHKDEASSSPADSHNVHSLPKRELPLGIVLDACPNIAWLAKSGKIGNWRDFLAAAETARPLLGVSPSAWDEARAVMGERDAAVTLAAIYQRQEQISSAGGYLRSLTGRARQAQFSTWPMIMALLRAKLEAAKERRGDPSGADASLATATSLERSQTRLEISDALRRKLDGKPKV